MSYEFKPIRVPGQCWARVLLASIAMLAGVLVQAGQAEARSVTVCASRVTLYETPGGAKVAVLHRGDRVQVLAVGADDPWWRVRARFGTRGWMRKRAACGHHS